METIGIKALKIFQGRGSLSNREKYPKIYYQQNNTHIDYDRNRDYLYFPLATDKTNLLNSPWYAFNMIKTASSKDKLLDMTFDLLNFLNWAIYYYKLLSTDYDSIPKDPNKESISDSMEWMNVFASIQDIELSEEEKKEIEKKLYKKNNFILKPSKFLKLCRLFVRGWYEEHIETIGSVKFAHYITNYIVNKEVSKPICPRYNANNDNLKKEVSSLFKKDKDKYEYKYKGFNIELNKHTNNRNEVTYTISVMHYESTETFYLFSRLYQFRYHSSIKN